MKVIRFAIISAAQLLLLRCPVSAGPTASSTPTVSFEVAGAPKWVKPIQARNSAGYGDDGGVCYLLVDQQESVEPRASFYHEVRQITSGNGVQNHSAISVSFDPSYQKLVFHFIRLLRKGTTTERLDRSQIALLQREKGMEEFLLDGTYTANCQLEDVRVDDVIEFAYTLEGDNPVKKGKYSTTFATDWSVPVRHAVTRVTYPSKRKLEFRAINRAVKPALTANDQVTEWFLEEIDVPARKSDQDIPAGYDPSGYLQVSEWGDWGKVVDWAIPLYQPDVTLSTELESEITRLNGIADPEERVLAALHFVQDEVRYLGIESGVRSHQPTAPSEVLRRRFGDCKDKATLLNTLLRKSEIDASPVLVSGDHRGGVADRLPSPGVFDHVIVQVRLAGGVHWLDATRAGQRGPLSQIYVKNFGCALVIRPGVNALEAIATPPGAMATKRVIENYRIPAPGGSGELEVITDYRGLWAENTRERFREKSRDTIQKDYLKYYARRFAQIKSNGALQYEESPAENACRTKEFYLIPGIWEETDDKNGHELLIYPGEIGNDVGSVGSSQRDDPLELDYPVQSVQEINAEMFQEWSLDGKKQDVKNHFFHFRGQGEAHGRRLQFSYSYESLADRVPVTDLPTYNAELEKVKESLGYSLTYTPNRGLLNLIETLGTFNWFVAAIFLWVMLVAVSVGGWYLYWSKLPAPLPPPLVPQIVEGIRGWLILVMLQHFMRPIGFLIQLLILFPSIFNLNRWKSLTEVGQAQYHPMWAPALLFELFFFSLCLVASGVLVFLFFLKRAAWPRAFAAFLVVLFIGIVLDTLLAQRIPAAASSVASNVRGLVQAIGMVAIWVPYCLRSKRVKATFRY